MAYLASIAKSLSVLCNPAWVVDNNKEWMGETQFLVIKHQRIDYLASCIYSASRNETLSQVVSCPDNAKYGQQIFSSANISQLSAVLPKDHHSEGIPKGNEESTLSPERVKTTSYAWTSKSVSPAQGLAATLQPGQEGRKYSLFDDSAWLEFPRFESLCGADLWSESEGAARSGEPPCRNDPAAWASWMRCQASANASAQPTQTIMPTPGDVAYLLQKPISEQELQELTELVLHRPGEAEQRLQRAMASPELRKLWESDQPNAQSSPIGGITAPSTAGVKTSEATYAAVAGGSQERLSWPQASSPSGGSRHRASASWTANCRHNTSTGPLHHSQGEASGTGGYSAPTAHCGSAQQTSSVAAPRAGQELSFSPVTSFSVTATYTSPVLMPVLPPGARRMDTSSVMVAMPQGSLVIPTLGTMPHHSSDITAEDCRNAGQQQHTVGAAVWPERSSEWYSLAGWQYPTLPQTSNANRFTAQQGLSNGGLPQHQSLKNSGQSTLVAPHEAIISSQFTPLQVMGPTIYAQNKGLTAVPYQGQAMTTFAKYAAQPNPCFSAVHQPMPRHLGVDSDTYKNFQVMFCQKAAAAGLPASNRAQFRSSISDSTIRGLDPQGKLSNTTVSSSSDHEPKPLESPRAPPTHVTFEDFLHLLGVSDGNNNDLFELWRIGQVGGSSGPPSTELSPRSDTLTPTAAASTPRDVNASAAAPGKLRRTKSLGSLPSVPCHQQPVTSSASKDSVSRRFDELEFLAIEQYESSDSLSRRFSDLERQALEQYTLLSQQGSRETLPATSVAAVMQQTPATVVPPAPAPQPSSSVNTNSRTSQSRSNTGGKPRKRRGKKKARELVMDTGIAQQGAWRVSNNVPNPACSVSASGSGWTVTGEEATNRRFWPAITQPCAVDCEHPGPVGTPTSVCYKTAVQHNCSQTASTFQNSAYVNSASDYTAPYSNAAAVGSGMRLPPPPFSTPNDNQNRPVMSSMPAGLLSVGPLGSQVCREALAHAARMPTAPVMWPQAFSTASTARGESAGRSQQPGAKSSQEPPAADVETSCVLQ